MAADEGSTITVIQDRQWVGDPRLWGYTCSLDRERIGVVPVLGKLTVPVESGTYSVTVRQWSFASVPVEVEVGVGDHLRLRADTPQGWRGFVHLLLHPRRALILVEPT